MLDGSRLLYYGVVLFHVYGIWPTTLLLRGIRVLLLTAKYQYYITVLYPRRRPEIISAIFALPPPLGFTIGYPNTGYPLHNTSDTYPEFRTTEYWLNSCELIPNN